MSNQKFLNSKEIKLLYRLLETQWGVSDKLDYAFLSNEDGKIFLVNKDISKISLDKIRINSIGMYFGEVRNDELRLSIEGSQIIGPAAKKNIVELRPEEAKRWMMGEDIEKEVAEKVFVIIKSGNDYLGCGKAKGKSILNFVPKIRRLRTII